MKIDITILTDQQLLALLQEFNIRMAEAVNTPSYKVVQNKYEMLRNELKRRRESNPVESPEVIRNDPSDQFGIINKEYLKKLDDQDYKTYIDWKWEEL